MDRGNIPGFYFDEEKGKYFRVQADHLVPETAKYSEGSVKHEERETKRRKLETQKQNTASQQAVKRARIFQHPVLGGNGLGRELEGNTRRNRDDALVATLKPSTFTVIRKATMTEWWPKRISTFERWGTLVGGYDPADHSYPLDICEEVVDEENGIMQWEVKSNLSAFMFPIKDIVVTEANNESLFAACCVDSLDWDASVLISKLDEDTLRDDEKSSSLRMPRCSAIWSLAFSPTGTSLALCGTEKVWKLDLNCNPICKLALKTPDQGAKNTSSGEVWASHTLDWLENNILAAQWDRSVVLWDTRAEGSRIRYELPTKVTGLHVPKRGGPTIVASTNHAINIFDNRFMSADRPLRCIPHVHEGPLLQYASDRTQTQRGNVLAAVDRDQYVHIYCLRTLRWLRRLPPAEGVSRTSRFRNLQWVERQSGGPELRALRYGKLTRWTWGKNEEEDFDAAG